MVTAQRRGTSPHGADTAPGRLCRDVGAGDGHQVREAAAQLYRLRLITADPLSLRNRTVCDLPCKTTLITPEIPYSLL
jgi:hypothetical protein